MSHETVPPHFIAVATCTLVVQYARNHERNHEQELTTVATVLAAASQIRPLATPDIHQNDSITELRCRVEFGPTKWDNDRHVRRRIQGELERITKPLAAQRRDFACDVFDLICVEFTSEQMDKRVADLSARMHDVATALAVRQQHATEIRRLRSLMDDSPSRSSPSARASVRWDATPELEVLKMLAWTIRKEERLGKDALWRRANALCERVMETVLQKPGVTFASVCAQTTSEQQADITASKLMQRADKTERYGEGNTYADAVRAAYQAIVNATPNVTGSVSTP